LAGKRSGIKKAGRFPIRERVGPAKNLLQRRTEKRPAGQTQWSLLAFRLWSKRANLKLGGFTRSFAEITDKKSLEPDFRWLRDRIPTDNLHPAAEKIKTHSDYLEGFPRGERIDSIKPG